MTAAPSAPQISCPVELAARIPRHHRARRLCRLRTRRRRGARLVRRPRASRPRKPVPVRPRRPGLGPVHRRPAHPREQARHRRPRRRAGQPARRPTRRDHRLVPRGGRQGHRGQPGQAQQNRHGRATARSPVPRPPPPAAAGAPLPTLRSSAPTCPQPPSGVSMLSTRSPSSSPMAPGYPRPFRQPGMASATGLRRVIAESGLASSLRGECPASGRCAPAPRKGRHGTRG